MPKMIDGRKYWSAEEAEFLSDPANLNTKEQNKEAQDYYLTIPPGKPAGFCAVA